MKKRLFFNMDNVLVDFQSGLDKIDEETKNQYRAKGPEDKDRLDEIPGLFGKMEPMPGAIEAVHKLAEEFDVFILSTAPWKNPSAWSDKVEWVTKYLDDVFHKRMIITHRKDLVEGDYLMTIGERMAPASSRESGFILDQRSSPIGMLLWIIYLSH